MKNKKARTPSAPVSAAASFSRGKRYSGAREKAPTCKRFNLVLYACSYFLYCRLLVSFHFEFTFDPVFDKAVLEDKLSAPSKVLLSQILGKEYVNTGAPAATARYGAFLDGGLTLDEETSSNPNLVYPPVKEGIADADGTIYSGPRLPLEVGIGDGGTLPVPGNGDDDHEDSITVQGNEYMVCAVRSGLQYAYTVYLTKALCQKIYRLVVTQENTDGTKQSKTINTPDAIYDGDQARMENIFTYEIDPEEDEIPAALLHFDLYLLDGSVISVKEVNAPFEACITGVFEGLSDDDTPEEDSTYTPTGFGVKQIGIADYLKVEQTVHCYVEGEVSHIENIMAREYKEKATRRLSRTEETTTGVAIFDWSNLFVLLNSKQ